MGESTLELGWVHFVDFLLMLKQSLIAPEDLRTPVIAARKLGYRDFYAVYFK